MKPRLQLILAVTWSSTFAVACADREATAPVTVPGGGFTAAITCEARVTAGTLSCGSSTAASTRGLNFEAVLGGQDTLVTLAGSNISYSAPTWQADVTVKNLTAQPMNTADGTTADTGGVKVFLFSGPNTTGGSGPVDVANEDGTGTFLGTDQKFFKFSSGVVLGQGSTTSPKTWQFTLGPLVTAFTFQVFVSTKLPADSSVLRWVSETSPTTETLRSVRINGGFGGLTTGWAVGDNGTILYYDGTSWSAVNTGLALTGINLYGVDANGGGGSGGVVYIVGDGGTIVYSGDGGVNWEFQSSGVTTPLFSVSRVGGGSNSTEVFAVGAGGVILNSADGTTWSQQTSNTTDSLFLTGGPGANDWYAAGQGGTGLHWNGTVWSPLTLNTTATIHSGTGAGGQSGLTDIWLAGTGGTIVHSPDGAAWTGQESGTTENLFGIAASGPADVFAVGSGGTIVHWNGGSWSAMASGSTENLKAVDNRSAGGFFVDVWAVGTGGTILHGIR